jgi:hypothetical protein
VSEGADGQLSLVETELWEPVPLPYPKPILFDSFTYDAEDEHGARDQATVFVYRDYLYYYDVGTDPVAETSQDVGDPGLLTV